MRKTILAFASVLVMLAAGMVLVGVSDDSDAADSIPAPEKPGLEGYPITVFKQDGSKVGLETLNGYTAADGDEIWVYKDVSDIETYRISGGIEVTIHLHYSTIEMAYLNNFKVNGGTLNIEGTGTVTEKREAFYYWPITMYGSADQENYSILNVGPGIELNGFGGVAVTYKDSDGSTNDDNGVVINFAGKVKTGKDTGGYDGYAFYVNGLVDTVTYRPIINILPGAVLDGGDGLGIYAAGNAEWNINGATIIGGTGIELRAGAMTISNSTITGTASTTTVHSNGNGSTTDGAGIAIAQHTTNLAISITVDSCDVRAATPFNEANPQSNTPYDDVSIAINSGTFTVTGNGEKAVNSSSGLTRFINGGTFSSEPTASYITSGKTLTSANGKWFVSVPVEETAPGKIETDETIINADLSTSTGTSIDMSSTGVKLDIAGSSGLGNIVVSAEERRFAAAPNAAASFEITIVTSTTYVADITVPAVIPSGFQALAYYIDDNGNLMPVEVVNYTSSTVTFRTTHTTPFVILAEEIVIPEIPGDDDDEYPFPPSHGSNQGTTTTPAEDSSDDKTKIIAAAAAVVVIMLAAVALMTNRNH